LATALVELVRIGMDVGARAGEDCDVEAVVMVEVDMFRVDRGAAAAAVVVDVSGMSSTKRLITYRYLSPLAGASRAEAIPADMDSGL
jgi:hypothetical protein